MQQHTYHMHIANACTHKRTHAQSHTHSIHHFSLNHIFHFFLASAARTHHLPVIQLYPSPRSSHPPLRSRLHQLPNQLSFMSSHHTGLCADLTYGTTDSSNHGGCWHVMNVSMNTVTCFGVFFLTQKHFCFHFSHQLVKFSTSCVPTTLT